MSKKLWKSFAVVNMESVQYVSRYLKMQFWHHVLTVCAGSAFWQVGETLVLVYVQFVGTYLILVPGFLLTCMSPLHTQLLTLWLLYRKAINRQDLITAPTENRFQIDIEKNWVESSKVVALMNELETIRLSGSKSILFSQWTAFLDLLQVPLSRYVIITFFCDELTHLRNYIAFDFVLIENSTCTKRVKWWSFLFVKNYKMEYQLQ